MRLARTLGLAEAGRALRDFATYLPTQVIPAIAGVLVLPILARELAPSELGVLAIAQTLITLGWTAAGSWLTTTLIRELPAAREAGELDRFSALMLRGLALSGVLFILFGAALAIGGTFSAALSSNVVLIAAATAGLILQNVAATLFAASLRPRAFAVVEVLARVGGIALGTALVFAGHKVEGYLLGLAIGSLVVGLPGVLFAWPRGAGETTREEPLLPELRHWVEYGVPIAIAGVATWALFLVDRYLLALLEDTAAVGVYSVGAVIGDKVVTIPTFAFFIAARPLLFTAMETRGRGEVERLVRAWTRVVLLIGAPIVAGAALVSSFVVEKLTGKPSYAPAAGVVPIVALGSLLWALALFGNAGLTTARKSRPFVYAAALALAANVIANLVLIPAYGIKGAAIATPIGNAVFLLAAQVWSRRYATWRFPWATLARTAAAAAAGYALGRGALEWLDSSVAAGVACVAVYLVVLVLLGERRRFATTPA
jgi:O-antigen/teichoic acid export membrane protein